MSTLEKLQNWLDTYRDIAFDLIRVYLGVGLLVRGALYFADTATYLNLVDAATAPAWLTSPALLYMIAITHLFGGALMAIGLLTRLAALIQIPILAGAVFVVHFQGGLMTASQSFEFTALVLFLLVLVFLYGSGQWSLDTYLGDRLGAYHRFDARLDERLAPHQNAAFGLVRLYLGVGLFVRGLFFVTNSAGIIDLVGDASADWLASVALSHFVTLTHLFGGALMAIGLLTRLAALIQIPILAGAVFVVHFQGGLMTASQSFEFTALVLFLLVLVFLYGSGQWSADYYIERQLKVQEAEEREAIEAARAHAERTRTPEPAEASEPFFTVAGARQGRSLTCPRTGNTCEILSAARPRHHSAVTAHPQYSVTAMFYFVGGITAPPKEIHFVCERCGLIVEKSQATEDLDKYRYRN